MSKSLSAWLETDRDVVVGDIVDGVVASMTEEELRKTVWHGLFDELVYANYLDLLDYAEEYAPQVAPTVRQLHQESQK